MSQFAPMEQQPSDYHQQQYQNNNTQQQSSGNEGRGLYVGNLDPRVTDTLLLDVFTTCGPIENCKIIKDKFGESIGYGFVDYYTREHAEKGIQELNGKRIYDKDIKVNWASHSNKDDSTNHFNIFVGDLSSEINDETLYKAFEAFGSITDARVMWDQSTGRSRGYGFVAFREKAHAEQAMTEMNSFWLGNRAIRCNWANQKVSGGSASKFDNIDDVTKQTAPGNTTVYIGNLPPDTNEALLGSTFRNYGTIEEIRIQYGKGYGFVKFATHEQAARAIVAANEMTLNGRPIRCSWGKERNTSSQQSSHQNPQNVMGYQQYYPNYMAYNMPYANYGQYYAQGDPNQYYTQGYDPYAAYAGYQYQQQGQGGHDYQNPR